MESLTLNNKARDAIQRSLDTNDFTEKRNLLATAIHRLQPGRDSKMSNTVSFSALVDDMLLVPPEQLESAVCEAAEKLWQ